MTPDRLGEAEALIAILESGSIAGGAQRLGVTPSAASRILARLESRLGVRLVSRTTRALRPTAEGTAFAAAAQAALDALTAAETEAAQSPQSPRGRLRVNASLAYAAHRILPRLGAFRALHPGIELDLLLTDRVVDLAAEGSDLAVRVGTLRPVAGLRARLIEQGTRITVASPDYLARRGTPARPADLLQHDRLDLSFARAQNAWAFMVDGKRVLVPPGRALRTDAGEAMRLMALSGLGIARVASFHAEADIAAGRLVPLLTGFELPERVRIHALWPADREASARVRAFTDFLVRR
jgi:DNA-binding transcriptional LysR family regulator